jgi:hypothetical protein
MPEEEKWETYTFTIDDTPMPIEGSDLIKREVLINRNVFVPSKKIEGETPILTVSIDLTKQHEKISSWPWIKNVFKNWSIDAWLEKHRESIFSITLDIHKNDFYLAIEILRFNFILRYFRSINEPDSNEKSDPKDDPKV